MSPMMYFLYLYSVSVLFECLHRITMERIGKEIKMAICSSNQNVDINIIIIISNQTIFNYVIIMCLLSSNRIDRTYLTEKNVFIMGFI